MKHQNEMTALEELEGAVGDVSFRNEESGFTVLDLECGEELVTAVGVLPHVSPGETLRLRGVWGYHQTFGRQFLIEFCERELPTTQSEVLRYLASGVIQGVRKAMAQRIVELFGDDTLEILEKYPQKLTRVKGISYEKAEQICESFRKQFSLRQVMISLERFGLSTNECLRAYKVFGARAPELVQSNPWGLCDGDTGVGFERADVIAKQLEVPPDGTLRCEAGVLHTLKRHCAQNGHTCVPEKFLVEISSRLLNSSPEEVLPVVEQLCEERRLAVKKLPKNGEKFLFLPSVFRAEESCGKKIWNLIKFPPAKTQSGEFSDLISKMEDTDGLHYDEKQRLAMQMALDRGLLIITGGPGTGKTTVLKGILQMFQRAGLKVALAAPTGRAAKRMQELTEFPAKTIHRLLEVEWGEDDRQRFARNEQNPLAAQAVIIDEISMVDISLFSALLDALPLGSRLVLVGDADQLPPVGAGAVLTDLLRANSLPVVRLTKIFRQSMESLIITNSHAIVRGEFPDLTKKDRDFFFLERNSTASAAQTIVQLCAERLPRAYGYDSLQEIQVLCPSRKGECGAVRLNELLQEALNPQKKECFDRKIAGRVFRVGDKVMQVRNNYDILWEREGENDPGSGIFNGDIGTIKGINSSTGFFSIQFDDQRRCNYPFDSAAEELEHAFAITVHKSQGSEFPCVVLPIIGIVSALSYRNLLYTAVTRARALLILVGSRQELQCMVSHHEKDKRHTALFHFLKENEENITN